eukprot:CAMPEP_0177445800 /NCGR_PEP_ID=MMETSP0369-20130122/6739_1 /TAXON_ID=447022 ORGANISM="Scrippsiella hangoei-like, Strain SHHI-4" /NCGR_SAMPLE_ID=MMETSP0369 /ASSEMBLY_ACC=CAM_ASM_000364 /LENGTH=39 /DNA_ID= /DNA_START= /DNA_END= /DNA_ORIENTATION=
MHALHATTANFLHSSAQQKRVMSTKMSAAQLMAVAPHEA